MFGCTAKTVPPPSAQVKQQPGPSAYGPPVDFESRESFVQNLRPESMGVRSWRELAPTLRKSLAYVNAKPQDNYAIRRDGLALTWGQMAYTLRSLEGVLPALDKDPDLFLRKFRWVPVEGGIKYSGYYEPMVKASRTAKPGYAHPIYCRPPELEQVLRGGKKYHARREIDENGRLRGRGLEMAYAADPVDVFYLQIQGSGRLAFDDGECIIVNYDGQNGHKYKSSGKIMREKGLLNEGHIFEQRQWFKDNPHRVAEILHEDPSYVFFKEGTSGPTGAIGKVIDPWMSIATDRGFIPLGSIVAYGVNIPDQRRGDMPLRAIGFSQDVGGAIKENRIDIFCGSDFRGEYVASHLDAKGPAWVLVSNDVAGERLVASADDGAYRAEYRPASTASSGGSAKADVKKHKEEKRAVAKTGKGGKAKGVAVASSKSGKQTKAAAVAPAKSGKQLTVASAPSAGKRAAAAQPTPSKGGKQAVATVDKAGKQGKPTPAGKSGGAAPKGGKPLKSGPDGKIRK